MKYFYESIAAVPSLSEIFKKLGQVERHELALRKSCQAYLDGSPLTTSREKIQKHHQFSVKSFQEVPNEIGDALTAGLSSARSLLNYCAQVLATSTLTSEKPPTNLKKIQFPICLNDKEFKAAITEGKLGFPSSKTIETVRAMQPFSNLALLFGGNNSDKEDPT